MRKSTRLSRTSNRSVQAADARLVVMVKHPAPGRVKTRLAAAVGPRTAADLSRAFVRDLAARLATLPDALTWADWPRGAAFRAVLGRRPARRRCRPPRGRDLGERTAPAVPGPLARGGGPRR